MMMITLKMSPTLWELQSIGGNKMTSHDAMTLPWNTYKPNVFPLLHGEIIESPKTVPFISRPLLSHFLSILMSLSC